MRDGVRLFSRVYVPKDASQPWPIIITRTPSALKPYGTDNCKDPGGSFRSLAKDLREYPDGPAGGLSKSDAARLSRGADSLGADRAGAARTARCPMTKYPNTQIPIDESRAARKSYIVHRKSLQTLCDAGNFRRVIVAPRLVGSIQSWAEWFVSSTRKAAKRDAGFPMTRLVTGNLSLETGDLQKLIPSVAPLFNFQLQVTSYQLPVETVPGPEARSIKPRGFP